MPSSKTPPEISNAERRQLLYSQAGRESKTTQDWYINCAYLSVCHSACLSEGREGEGEGEGGREKQYLHVHACMTGPLEH